MSVVYPAVDVVVEKSCARGGWGGVSLDCVIRSAIADERMSGINLSV